MTSALLAVAVIVLALAFLWALRRAQLYEWLWEGECSLNDALIHGTEMSDTAANGPREAANRTYEGAKRITQ